MTRRQLVAMRCFIFVVWTVFLCAATAVATTVPPLSLEEKWARADVVALVRIEAKEAMRIGADQRRIATLHRARVLEVWRNANKSPLTEVTIGLPGGVVGPIGQIVPGTPVLEVGRDYVAFLGPPVGPQGARATIGLWQGIYLVALDGNERPLLPFTHGGLSSSSAPLSLDELRRRTAVSP